jgi:bifunctional DNase/RNase
MVLECIAFHDNSPLTVIVLRETDGNRLFLLPGDYYTSAAVSQSVQKLERPGTHHAMAMLLEACEASLQQVVVENRDSAGAFHTMLTIRVYGITKRIDVRPSDALALSHVCKVPFMVNSSLLVCEESGP